MSLICILVADNDEEFLDSFSELLDQPGYSIYKASNPGEVTYILQNKLVHLAVLDMRLTNDKDENDFSGILLAKQVARYVPKVILTREPSFEAARRAFRPDGNGMPPVVDFIDKKDKKLVEAIQEAVFRYIDLDDKNFKSKKLLEAISNQFNISELKLLCFDLGMDYEELKGEFKNDTIMNLIGHFQRRNQLPVLTEACQKHRPNFGDSLSHGIA